MELNYIICDQPQQHNLLSGYKACSVYNGLNNGEQVAIVIISNDKNPKLFGIHIISESCSLDNVVAAVKTEWPNISTTHYYVYTLGSEMKCFDAKATDAKSTK